VPDSETLTMILSKLEVLHRQQSAIKADLRSYQDRMETLFGQARAAACEAIVFTIPQTASALQLSIRSVYDLLNDGDLPFVLMDGKRRVRLLDLQRCLDGLQKPNLSASAEAANKALPRRPTRSQRKGRKAHDEHTAPTPSLHAG
jgi:hypothetical protein